MLQVFWGAIGGMAGVDALALFALAAVGAAIAWRQANMARTRLQLDLYAKRLPAFQSVRTFLGELSAERFPSAVAVRALAEGTGEVSYLFGPEIARYVKRLHEVSHELEMFDKMPVGRASGAESPAETQRWLDLRAWIGRQPAEAEVLFTPYLLLDDRLSSASGANRPSASGGSWWERR